MKSIAAGGCPCNIKGEDMTCAKRRPRVLLVTPEVAYLPVGMGGGGHGAHLSAKWGELADVSAALIADLFRQGADIHLAIPDYRTIFNGCLSWRDKKQRRLLKYAMPDERIHFAEDRAFYYRDQIYSPYCDENIKISLAFQREVINNIVPEVQPDLIHCNDWMTGLIPGMARKMGIPCLFTIHYIHTVKSPLSCIEDSGIDAAKFWQQLYYEHMSSHYEETRSSNPVDFLVSGVFAAHFVNMVSPAFLQEVVDGKFDFVSEHLKRELANKHHAGCTTGILNAPDPSFDPATDNRLECRYNAETHVAGKKENKKALQQILGLARNDKAPLFFWPSRLDVHQKGCHLLSDILYDVISMYWHWNLQVVFVADGEYKQVFEHIRGFHGFEDRVAVSGYNRNLASLAYGAADFILMPSCFEPCGLPQMIGPIYGALPVAHDTGGIHDTVMHFNPQKGSGNGFLFKTFDSGGLLWAMTEAMRFYQCSGSFRAGHIRRIMTQSRAEYRHENTARKYINLYEKMLKRPLIVRDYWDEQSSVFPEKHDTSLLKAGSA